MLRQADQAFAERDDPQRLRAALALIEAVPEPGASDYEVLWRRAKYRYYLGTREADAGQATELIESAIDLGQRAIRLDPSKPDAHLWLAAAYGESAQSVGAEKALSLIPVIRAEYELVLASDPKYENGAAWEALGDLDLRLPSIYGGDRLRGITRLERGIGMAPSNADMSVTLARAYAVAGRRDDARRLLQQVLNSRDPLKSPAEQDQVTRKARDLWARLGGDAAR